MKAELAGVVLLVVVLASLALAPARPPELCTLEPAQFQALLNANRFGQVLDSARPVDLTLQADHVALASIGPGEKLLHLGCTVTEPVQGAPLVDLRFVGRLANNIRVYDDANRFFAGPGSLGGIQPFSHGQGSLVGDRFDLVLPVAAAEQFEVEMEVTTPATAGRLQCITWIAN